MILHLSSYDFIRFSAKSGRFIIFHLCSSHNSWDFQRSGDPYHFKSLRILMSKTFTGYFVELIFGRWHETPNEIVRWPQAPKFILNIQKQIKYVWDKNTREYKTIRRQTLTLSDEMTESSLLKIPCLQNQSMCVWEPGIIDVGKFTTQPSGLHGTTFFSCAEKRQPEGKRKSWHSGNEVRRQAQLVQKHRQDCKEHQSCTGFFLTRTSKCQYCLTVNPDDFQV